MAEVDERVEFRLLLRRTYAGRQLIRKRGGGARSLSATEHHLPERRVCRLGRRIRLAISYERRVKMVDKRLEQAAEARGLQLWASRALLAIAIGPLPRLAAAKSAGGAEEAAAAGAALQLA